MSSPTSGIRYSSLNNEGTVLVKQSVTEYKCSSRLCGRGIVVVRSETFLKRLLIAMIFGGIIGSSVGGSMIAFSDNVKVQVGGGLLVVAVASLAFGYSLCLILFCRALGKEVKNAPFQNP